ncbi:hypothetical protein D3C76_1411930 [compost metagenome]
MPEGGLEVRVEVMGPASIKDLKNMMTVGAGLLANAVCHSTLMCLTYRIREQARSHMYCAQPLRTVRIICVNACGP